MNGFLLDEHLPLWWPTAVCRLESTLIVAHIGDPGAPPFGTLDPDILDWCEANQAWLLTNNRSTMPGHLADLVLSGRSMPGIFMVNPKVDVRILANSLALLRGAALPGEFDNLIFFLPLIAP